MAITTFTLVNDFFISNIPSVASWFHCVFYILNFQNRLEKFLNHPLSKTNKKPGPTCPMCRKPTIGIGEEIRRMHLLQHGARKLYSNSQPPTHPNRLRVEPLKLGLRHWSTAVQVPGWPEVLTAVLWLESSMTSFRGFWWWKAGYVQAAITSLLQTRVSRKRHPPKQGWTSRCFLL